MHGQNLRQLYESLGPVEFATRLQEAFREGHLDVKDFSLLETARACCGHDWVSRLNPRNLGRYSSASLLEAGEGVDVTAFSAITGQIVYTRIHQGWDQAGEISDQLFETVPTMFDGERVPGIGKIVSEGESIRPGMPYPEAGFGQQYWDTPATAKHGMIVSVDKETIFFDRTSLIVKRAGEIGERLRMNKEVRCLAVLAGVTVQEGNETFVGNNHKWNGTSYNTYATGANAIGINSLGSMPLVDYTSLEQAYLLAAVMNDPDTGRPIRIKPDRLVVMPMKLATAQRIMTATELRSTFPAYQASASAPGNVQMVGGNPISPMFPNMQVVSSPLLYQIIVASGVAASAAKDWWFVTQKGKAFEYRENWPLTTVQAPPNNTAEFERDVVLRWKSSERGVPWSSDPRYTYKLYNA